MHLCHQARGQHASPQPGGAPAPEVMGRTPQPTESDGSQGGQAALRHSLQIVTSPTQQGDNSAAQRKYKASHVQEGKFSRSHS